MNGDWHQWIGSVAGSMLVGLSGIVPLLIIPDTTKQQDSSTPLEQSSSFRLLLSFAVGGLLGDVFLHLLPEAWRMVRSGESDASVGHLKLGLWLLAGLLTFAVIELVLSSTASSCLDDDDVSDVDSDTQNNNTSADTKKPTKSKATTTDSCFFFLNPFRGISSRRVTGYLNLLANGIDNFTHGLAVAGSFLVSTRVGLLTTMAILLHEIPHEVADFAILLRAGFGRWDAARAQLGTATVGVAGALTALATQDSSLSDGHFTSWILPFTAGGFLHISLVTVLPELLEEKQPKQSLLQVIFIIAGIVATAAVTLFID